jgi:DNA-binding transcriptional regulator PaaX
LSSGRTSTPSKSSPVIKYTFLTYVRIVYMNTREAVNSTLKVLGVAGLAGITIVAPNALQGLNLILRKSPVSQTKYRTVLNELRRQGLVHIVANDEQQHFTLTPAGIHRLQRVIVDEVTIPTPKHWDRRWRLVTFDVPVKQSKERAYFTAQLQDLGFMMLQKSMWVYPYPCFKEIEQIAGYYNVLRYCTLIEADRLDELSTKKLLRHFHSIL